MNSKNNMKINQKKLYELYMAKIYQICEDLEDKSHFSVEEIIQIMSEILEKNPELLSYE